MMSGNHEAARPLSRAEVNMLRAWEAKGRADENLAARVAAAFPIGREFTLRTERNRQYYYLTMRVVTTPNTWHEPGTVRAENVHTRKTRNVNLPFSLSRGDIT